MRRLECVQGSNAETTEVCPDLLCEASESREVGGADAVAEDELRSTNKGFDMQGWIGVECRGVKNGELNGDKENKAAGLRRCVSEVQRICLWEGLRQPHGKQGDDECLPAESRVQAPNVPDG